MNGSQMLDIMGLIDPAFIEAAETAGTCAKPAHISVFRKRPWVKWAAVAAAVLIVAAGAPGAIYMMRNFGSGGFVDPNGSGTPGIVSPADGGSSAPSGEGEAQGGSDAESGSKPKAPDSSVAHGNGSGSAAPGGNQPSNDPKELVITGWEEPSGETGEFVKDNMPDITLRINGENKSFYYEKSTYIKSNNGIAFDGSVICNTIDRYINSNGDFVIKNADANDILQYEAELFVSAGLRNKLSEEEAAETAKQIACDTDIPIRDLKNATALVRKEQKTYCVTLATSDVNIEVLISLYGDFVGIKAFAGVQHEPSSEKIDTAKEKMYIKLAKLNNEASGGKYVLDKAHFEAWGENTYIVFAVNYYYDTRSDAHSVRDYYFLV